MRSLKKRGPHVLNDLNDLLKLLTQHAPARRNTAKTAFWPGACLAGWSTDGRDFLFIFSTGFSTRLTEFPICVVCGCVFVSSGHFCRIYRYMLIY